MRDLALEYRPKLIVAGATAYARLINPEPFRAIADEVGAMLMFDSAHVAGLIAGNAHPSPVPIADVVTFTTHKTLRGPRGGAILCREEYAKKIDSAVFPGQQGGPARTRHRGQGGRLQGGEPAELRGLRRTDRRERAGLRHRAGQGGLSYGLGWHRKSHGAR